MKKPERIVEVIIDKDNLESIRSKIRNCPNIIDNKNTRSSLYWDDGYNENNY